MALKTWATGENLLASDLNNNFAQIGYVLRMTTSGSGSPADATTYFMADQQIFTISTASDIRCRLYIPKAGTIKAVYGAIGVSGTLGSSENITVALRLNNSTDINVTTTLQLTTAYNIFNNAALGTAVVAGDYLEFKVVCPTWVTNPTGLGFAASVFIQ
jgi:hypothetical protein